MKTQTLFHTIKLDTGTWTIEVVHGESTTHIHTPQHAAREAMPADPWSDVAPLAYCPDGKPLYAPTMMLPIRR